MASSDTMTIAVMGATGTGKSTFINLASGSHLPVGQGLKSCTARVDISQPFTLSGRQVTLIDTPGFDDTSRTDGDILTMIADYMKTSYQNNKKLNGIIYMHRISDVRMSGISRRNFNMFRTLCGDTTLKNVLVVTNMWGQVSEQVGAAREHELATDGILFKPVLDKGASMRRHNNTRESALDILRFFADKGPATLQIQHEMVDQGKGVMQTAAGAELAQEIAEENRKHQEELERQRREAAAQAAAREAETKRQIEELKRQQEAQAEQQRLEQQRIREQQEAERRRQEEMRQAAERQLAEQRRIEAEQRAHAQRLEEEARRAREAQEAEAHRLRQQLEEEQRRQREWEHHHSGGGGGCMIQ